MGRRGSPLPMPGKNLIMALPPDNIDLPALLLLHVPGSAGSLTPHYGPHLGAPPMGCIRRILGLCGAEPSVGAVGELLKSRGLTA
jgi:hypothetical protein